MMLDLTRTLEESGKVEIVTLKSPEVLDLIRYDAAHVMAQAVQELFSSDDLPKIEAKMHEIIFRDQPFVRHVMSRQEAINHFEKKGEQYKVELIRDLPPDQTIAVYSQGNEWEDLCRGPHFPSTGRVGKAFKVMKVAGAYWRGDSKNAQLQRIYGTAWRDDKELQGYLIMLEEAEKRDHRKLGCELDLFHFQDEAPDSVFWHLKGWAVYRSLESLYAPDGTG